jgi:hypothetical protein
MYMPGGTLFPTFVGSLISPDSASTNPQRLDITASYLQTTAIDSFKVFVSGGAKFSGTVRIFYIH